MVRDVLANRSIYLCPLGSKLTKILMAPLGIVSLGKFFLLVFGLFGFKGTGWSSISINSRL